jgi:Flp pilus assembly protein TadD
MAILGDVRQSAADDPRLLRVLGQAQLAQGDGAAAKATLKQLVAIQPQSADAHFLLAKAHALLGDGAGATAELESAVKLEPNQLQARLALARVLVTQREYDAARQQLGALKAIAPDNPDVLMLEGDLARAGGESGEARDLYAKAFENLSNTTTMLALAQQEWAIGDRERALSRLQEWVESNPDDVSVRLRLAEAYQALGRTDEALGQYNEILALSENNVLALNNLAWQLRDTNPAQALKYAEKATTLAADSPDVADTYAVVLMKNGETERALRVSEQALGKKRSPDIVYHRAMILDAAGRGSEAMELLVPLLRDTEKVPFPERREAQELLARLQKK